MLKVYLESDEYGTDEHGPYDSDEEAADAAGRLAVSAAKATAKDGIERWVLVELADQEEDDGDIDG